MSKIALEGRCLCGAVTVRTSAENPLLRACHCDMCRRHTSGAFVSIRTDGEAVVEGPAASYQSSDWAERGFCSTCGSTLWYGTLHDGVRNFAAGLFDNAGGAPLVIEFFEDRCPQGYSFAGDHKKLDSEATVALFTGGDD